MGTGYCNCVTLRAKVRLAIEALEGVTRFTRVRQGLSAPLYEIINVDELYKAWNTLVELKKEIGE